MTYHFVVSGFEDGQAILKDEQDEVVVWPQAKLPENISVGSDLYFNIQNQKNIAADNPQLAKDILNEILKIS